jgi:hypothetical protein
MPGHVGVRCDRCGFATDLATRDEFAVLEDLHTEACAVAGLTLPHGAIDDVLRLPPRQKHRDV